jgi:hypothetical protein
LEHNKGIWSQLGDITNLLQDQAKACARKKEVMDERWEVSQARRADKGAKCQELQDMVNKIIEDCKAIIGVPNNIIVHCSTGVMCWSMAPALVYIADII